MLEGVVINAVRYGGQAQTVSGVEITIRKGLAKGTVQMSGDTPAQTYYVPDKEVAKATSGQDGKFRVELPAGVYFVSGSAGERASASSRQVEVKENATVQVELEIIYYV